MQNSTPITCVVVDDHPALIQAIVALLEAHGIDICATATDGKGAVAAVLEHRPLVALVDISMPGIGGIEVTSLLAREAPDTRVILYTGSRDESLLRQALAVGAWGFVLKDVALDDVPLAIEVVAAGNKYVDSALAGNLVGEPAGACEPLSRREREILRLFADGKRIDAIAAELVIAPDTVRTYLRRAMQKLDAETRTHAVAIALREHLID